MDERTLTALRGSIAKWEGIVAGTEYDGYSTNCPLCQLFAYPSDSACDGCPVREETGRSSCEETPYIEWDSLFGFMTATKDRVANSPARKAAAQAELDFLISLLPAETQNT